MFCDICPRRSDFCFKCDKCQCMTYCSKKCQLSDWIDHKDECNFIVAIKEDLDLRMEPEVPSDRFSGLPENLDLNVIKSLHFKTRRTWMNLRYWNKEEFETCLKEYNDFILSQADPQIEKEKCRGCNQMCVKNYVCGSYAVCALCDDTYQPFFCNPKNRYLAKLFLEPLFRVDEMLDNM